MHKYLSYAEKRVKIYGEALGFMLRMDGHVQKVNRLIDVITIKSGNKTSNQHKGNVGTIGYELTPCGSS
jgi:hypothetical protein